MQTTHPIPVNIEKCRLNKTSAQFDPSLSFEDWLSAGSQLAAVNHATLFWVGDWATFGRTAFGQRAADAMRESHILGIDPQQLLLPGLISASIEPEQRRESLSFGHHCEVAEMQKRDQAKWLDLAEKAGWSVSEFRAQIRRSQGTQNAHASDGPVIKTIGNKLDDVKTFIVSQPAEFWDEERKRIWRDRIRPIVEFYTDKLAA